MSVWRLNYCIKIVLLPLLGLFAASDASSENNVSFIYSDFCRQRASYTGDLLSSVGFDKTLLSLLKSRKCWTCTDVCWRAALVSPQVLVRCQIQPCQLLSCLRKGHDIFWNSPKSRSAVRMGLRKEDFSTCFKDL